MIHTKKLNYELPIKFLFRIKKTLVDEKGSIKAFMKDLQILHNYQKIITSIGIQQRTLKLCFVLNAMPLVQPLLFHPSVNSKNLDLLCF